MTIGTMAIPCDWNNIAFNQVPHSSNQIHGDELAAAYGFKGGLVPGVTVASYLIHPAIEAWGKDWLVRGRAKVVVTKPLYHGESFSIACTEVSTLTYSAELFNPQGLKCAYGDIALVDISPPPPVIRHDPLLADSFEKPPAIPDVMKELKTRGMLAYQVTWNAEHDMATYLEEKSEMPQLLNGEIDVFANPSFMLGVSNWVLANNVYMNPWIHLQTESQNFQAVKMGTDLIVECAIEDLFEKKGHEFVDVQVNCFKKEDDSAVMSIKLRAIYKLRDMVSE